MTIRVLLRDHPHRAVALATDDHILTFRHSPSTAGASSLSVNSTQSATLQPRCMVEFARTADTDTTDFRSLTSLSVFGTLGLITINGDIFLCVVNGAQRAASVRNGENVLKITSVEFRESGSLWLLLFNNNKVQIASTSPTMTISFWIASTISQQMILRKMASIITMPGILRLNIPVWL